MKQLKKKKELIKKEKKVLFCICKGGRYDVVMPHFYTPPLVSFFPNGKVTLVKEGTKISFSEENSSVLFLQDPPEGQIFPKGIKVVSFYTFRTNPKLFDYCKNSLSSLMIDTEELIANSELTLAKILSFLT